jgi:hypothetical protein
VIIIASKVFFIFFSSKSTENTLRIFKQMLIQAGLRTLPLHTY